MTFEEFKLSLTEETLPPALPKLLQALWYDAKKEWDKAHSLAQDEDTLEGSWVHAYLHRKEGDIGNASYWYSCANRKMPQGDLRLEWEEIVQHLLSFIK